jgi:hypothetical protein
MAAAAVRRGLAREKRGKSRRESEKEEDRSSPLEFDQRKNCEEREREKKNGKNLKKNRTSRPAPQLLFQLRNAPLKRHREIDKSQSKQILFFLTQKGPEQREKRKKEKADFLSLSLSPLFFPKKKET